MIHYTIQYCNTLFFTLENGRQYRFLYIKQFTCNKSRHLTNSGFFFLSIGKTSMNIHVQVHRMKNQQRVSAKGANPGTNYCMCRILWAQVWKKWQYNLSVFWHICYMSRIGGKLLSARGTKTMSGICVRRMMNRYM